MHSWMKTFAWLSAAASCASLNDSPIVSLNITLNNTRSLVIGCPDGAIVTSLNFRPWCACPPQQPYCSGDECHFSWAPSTIDLNISLNVDFKLYSAANVTEATDRGWVLFDGFGPNCDNCQCYEAERSQQPTLQAAMRRYYVIHSHVRWSLRPRRSLLYEGGAGGGWGDKLRGLLGCFLFAIQHDLAFFLNITDPIPLTHVFEPHAFDWRFPERLRTRKRKFTTAMFQKRCQEELKVMKKTMPANDTSRTYWAFGMATNHWPIKCMFNWSRPSEEIYAVYSRFRKLSKDDYGGGGALHAIPMPSKEDQALAVARGLHTVRSPSTTAFQLLFQPTYRLLALRQQLQQQHGMQPSDAYMAIHLRTGLDFAKDPNRLPEEAMHPSFDCVLAFERELGLSNTTKWFIASDYHKAHGMLEDWLEAHNQSKTKVMGLRDLGGVISHVAKDRSAIGATFAYFDFMMLTGARVIFGTDSGFNRMATVVSGHERRVMLPACLEFPAPY